jgi:hypothetical protein
MEKLREEERTAGRKQLTGFIVFGTHTQLHTRPLRTGEGGGGITSNTN